jgi:succinoglycan biosynthesis protein ExoU
MTHERATAVIITAKDAAATVAYAVASALHQKPVREVIVVDDGSRDNTADVAAHTDDNSGRLKIIRLETNVGPSRARNIAIDASSSPLICILDADDYFSPSRLERLYSEGGDDWDLLADDLFFTPTYDGSAVTDRLLPASLMLPARLDLPTFITGNISRKDRFRREFGFLKPVIRRAFLARHGLRYDERVRLGEDLVLYANALLRGARFRLVEGCGYFAVERSNSLSGAHRTADIAALYQALIELDASAAAHAEDRRALRRLLTQTKSNLDFRRLLDAKRDGGWRAAVHQLPTSLSSLQHIAREVLTARTARIGNHIRRTMKPVAKAQSERSQHPSVR